MNRFTFALLTAALMGSAWTLAQSATSGDGDGPSAVAGNESRNADWNQWGGSAMRNNTPEGHAIPSEWKVGDFDHRTGEWDSSAAKNIKWVARLGSQSYGNPVVAGGKVFVGTNNSGGWLKRYPAE